MQSRRFPLLPAGSALLLAGLLSPLAHAQAVLLPQPATGPREQMAPPLPRPPEAALQGLQSLELTASGNHLTNGYEPWRELALRGAYALPGNLLQGELSAHRRFGEDGVYAGLMDTHEFNADWFGSASVGAGDGAFYLPRYRVDLSLSRKWLETRSFVTTAGLGYYKAPDGHTDRSLLLGAAYYFVTPWIIEGGVRFNTSNPGSVRTTQGFAAVTYGRQGSDVVTARVAGGGEGYLATGPTSQLVDFRSHEASLSWRHWVAKDTAIILGANYYHNPTYTRSGATIGLVHQF